MTDPYFDLGDFVMEHPFTRDEERLSWRPTAVDGRARSAALRSTIVTGVWWSVWAIVNPAHRLADRLRLHGVGTQARRHPEPRASVVTTPTTSSGWRHSEKSTRVRGERGYGVKVRLFFATDVHGSEVCWRKFINSAATTRPTS